MRLTKVFRPAPQRGVSGLRVGLVVLAALVATCGVACGSSSSGSSAHLTDGGADAARTDVDGAAPSDAAAVTDGPASGTDSGNTTDGSIADSAQAADGGACPIPFYSPPVTSITPGTITATIHDSSDAPAFNVLAELSGLNLAIAGMSAADGSISLTLTDPTQNTALHFGDGLTYGEFLVEVTAPGMAVGTVHTVALPANGQAMTAGATAVSGPLTLTIPAGDTVSVDTLDYPTPSEQELRAAAIPVATATVDPAVGLELVYGTGPLGTLFFPPVKVSVPNTQGWAAGTAVDFYVLGLDVGQAFAPYGKWQIISAGAVTSDGSAIETANGAGLPYLSTLALRRH